MNGFRVEREGSNTLWLSGVADRMWVDPGDGLRSALSLAGAGKMPNC